MKPVKSNGKAPADASLADVARARDELVAAMREDGTWQPMFGPLLAEVGEALRLAGRLRAEAEEKLFARSERSGRAYAHPGIEACDREIRRAALLLQRVVSMAGPPRPVEKEEPEELDPLAQLDAMTQFSGDPVVDARIHRERRERRRELS